MAASPLNRYTSRPLPAVDGVEHRMFEVGDVDIHVAQAGDGAPQLLIHGYPQHWYVWRRLLPELARERRVICPDLRGFGWSQAPADGYDKETLMRDVLAVLDQLGVGSVPIAGHDWGGWIAMLIGILAPERVERVVIMGVFHPFMKRSFTNLARSWHVWHGMTLGTPGLGPRAARPRSLPGRAITRWLGSGSWSEEERRIFLDQFEEPARLRAAHLLYWRNATTDFPKVMGGRYRNLGLDVPTLFLYGERDRAFIPWHPKDYQPYAPKLTIEKVPGAGHALLEDRPALVLERIQGFLLGPKG
jgi:pimeloyl-ACP methyl ester carboxylesterase